MPNRGPLNQDQWNKVLSTLTAVLGGTKTCWRGVSEEQKQLWYQDLLHLLREQKDLSIINHLENDPTLFRRLLIQKLSTIRNQSKLSRLLWCRS